MMKNIIPKYLTGLKHRKGNSMVDREILEAIKAEIRKLKDNPYFMLALKEVGIIDSLQEEPVSKDLKKAMDESLAKNAEANDALQEGLRNGKKAVLIIGDDMPEYKCIFIPNGFSAKIEGNKVIFTKDKEPASNEVSEMEFKRLDIPDLKKAAMNYSKFYSCVQAFMDGAKWQKEQMMKDTIDTTIK